MAAVDGLHECDYNLSYRIWNGINATMALAVLGTSTYFIYQFIHRPRHATDSKRNYYIALVFSFVSYFSFINHFLFPVICITTPPLFRWNFKLWIDMQLVLYFIQYYLLLLLFVARIRKVFIGTIHRLSKFTVRIIQFLFIMVLINIIGIYLPPLTQICGVLYFIFLTTLITFILVLFVRKLIALRNPESDHAVTSIATKVTLLTIISITLSNINAGFALIQANGVLLYGESNFVAILDYFTNFICIIL